jgi:hypothetical protein
MFSKRRYSFPKNSPRNRRSNLLFLQALAITATIVISITPPSLAQEEEPLDIPQFDFSEEPFFLTNAISALSTKFPFDMLGSTTGGSSGGDCPTYEFFGENIQLCILRDIIMAVKIPAQIAVALMFYQRI